MDRCDPDRWAARPAAANPERAARSAGCGKDRATRPTTPPNPGLARMIWRRAEAPGRRWDAGRKIFERLERRSSLHGFFVPAFAIRSRINSARWRRLWDH